MMNERVRSCWVDPDEREGRERTVSLVQSDGVAYLERTARVRRALLGRPGDGGAGAAVGADGGSDLAAQLQERITRYRGVRMAVQLHSGNLRAYLSRLEHMLDGTRLAGNTRRVITGHIERGAVILANWDRLAATAEQVAIDAEQLQDRARRLNVRTLDRPIIERPWQALQDMMQRVDVGVQHLHAVGVIGWYRRYYERYLPIVGTYDACRQVYERPREPDDDDPDLPPEAAGRYSGAPGFSAPGTPSQGEDVGGRHVVYQSGGSQAASNGSQTQTQTQTQTLSRSDTAAEPWRIANATQGHDAPWSDQARFFMRGERIGGDRHRRRFWFSDDSYVDIQAHVPVVTRSRDNRLAILGSAMAVGGGTLWWTRNVVVAALVGVISSLVMAAGLPYDSVWQAYTARFYRSTGDAVGWRPRYFYGWKRSLDITCRIRVGGETDPAKFANFADDPASFSWHGWYSGDAVERHAPVADSLVQSMAAFSPPNAGALLAHGCVSGALCAGSPMPLMGSSAA